MFARLHAQFHEVRLGLRGRRLRHRERMGLRRLGEEVARAEAGGSEAFARLAGEIAEGERRAAALVAEGRASLDADRADLRAVAAWVKPAVVLRGVCTRLVLRHRRSAERKRWVAPYGGRSLPDWTTRAGAQTAVFGRAIVTQLRSHLLPNAPAIAGLTVGWWIANTYTDSHLHSALRSLGIGSGGTRVVSSSTYEAMTFWLPLLAAALCAYFGERLGAYYRGRGSADR